MVGGVCAVRRKVLEAEVQNMAFQGDARNRRNILQGLQQTKSRLQRLHCDGLARSAQHQLGSQSSVSQSQVAVAPISKKIHSSPSPNEITVQLQQQKVLMQQASAQSFSFFIPQQSLHGNNIMPVLPRFSSDGQLDVS
jgi:hypothetical protein